MTKMVRLRRTPCSYMSLTSLSSRRTIYRRETVLDRTNPGVISSMWLNWKANAWTAVRFYPLYLFLHCRIATIALSDTVSLLFLVFPWCFHFFLCFETHPCFVTTSRLAYEINCTVRHQSFSIGFMPPTGLFIVSYPRHCEALESGHSELVK